jgi:hypothetical protein
VRALQLMITVERLSFSLWMFFSNEQCTAAVNCLHMCTTQADWRCECADHATFRAPTFLPPKSLSKHLSFTKCDGRFARVLGVSGI